MSLLTSSAAARKTALRNALTGALEVKYDDKRYLHLAWKGRKEILIYAQDGMLVARSPLKRCTRGQAEAVMFDLLTTGAYRAAPIDFEEKPPQSERRGRR